MTTLRIKFYNLPYHTDEANKILFHRLIIVPLVGAMPIQGFAVTPPSHNCTPFRFVTIKLPNKMETSTAKDLIKGVWPQFEVTSEVAEEPTTNKVIPTNVQNWENKFVGGETKQNGTTNGTANGTTTPKEASTTPTPDTTPVPVKTKQKVMDRVPSPLKRHRRHTERRRVDHERKKANRRASSRRQSEKRPDRKRSKSRDDLNGKSRFNIGPSSGPNTVSFASGRRAGAEVTADSAAPFRQPKESVSEPKPQSVKRHKSKKKKHK
mmetsp:Transcript_29603/g.32976  ORF Transcript_29603/g.32976 Transcript_29603/m.32976 type:complete len:265 (+) Transcript_29603:32-826(+)